MTEFPTLETSLPVLHRARIALEEACAGPAGGVLAAAPTLHMWQGVLIRADLCLAGRATGHPQLKSDFVTTSPLIALDQDLRWARTLSRFYRLEGYLPTTLNVETAPNSREEFIVEDVYGWPALGLSAMRSYLAQLADYIRANTEVH